MGKKIIVDGESIKNSINTMKSMLLTSNISREDKGDIRIEMSAYECIYGSGEPLEKLADFLLFQAWEAALSCIANMDKDQLDSPQKIQAHIDSERAKFISGMLNKLENE